jgi:hypothetical protein
MGKTGFEIASRIPNLDGKRRIEDSPSDFFFRISFGFRISGFGFVSTARLEGL